MWSRLEEEIGVLKLVFAPKQSISHFVLLEKELLVFAPVSYASILTLLNMLKHFCKTYSALMVK